MPIKKRTRICLVIALLVILFFRIRFFSAEKRKNSFLSQIKEKIHCISLEDQMILDCFFRTLVQKHCAGHVLYGSKPLCFVGFSQTDLFSFLPSLGLNRHDLVMQMGLSTWKKYASLFPMNEFALIDYQEPGGNVTILLINKRSLIQRVKNELCRIDHFYLRDDVAEEFLGKILRRDPSFFEEFEKNEEMKGILLGYGANNAKLFARKMKIWNALGEAKHKGRIYRIKPKKFTLNILHPSKGFSSLREELEFLDAKSRILNNSSSNFNFSPRVGFVADNFDSETKKLRKRYQLEQRQIPSLYANGDFLITTLAKLVE